MLEIKKIFLFNFSECFQSLFLNFKDSNCFKSLGWSQSQFNFQLSKKIYFGLGLFKQNILKGFVIRDLITIEKKLEYEILLLYVSKQRRKLGYATKLITNISLFLEKLKLYKILLEISANNHEAINLYQKNKFKKTGIRKNYYNIKHKKIINE